MAVIASLIFAFLALGLQATLVPHIAIAGVRPDLAVVATVFLGFARGAFGGTIAGFAIGLAQESAATVVTGDPEFKEVEKLIPILWLPR